MDFHIGDFVEVLHKPSRQTYRGVIMDFTDDYVVITPQIAFPHEDVLMTR